MMNILELTFEQFLANIQSRFNKGAYHAAAVYRQVFGSGTKMFVHLPEFAQSPQLAQTISRRIRLNPAPIVTIQTEEGVTKFVSRLEDGQKIESVLVPMANHLALCVSSQVGCRMGCRICRTGRMGFYRHLTVAEIVGQVLQAKMVLGADIRNLVFMGMGEPLDNFETVMQAIRVISDQRGFNIAPKHITLSTVGLVEGIQKLAASQLPQLKLALSLNAADDRTRSALMPINRTYPLNMLKRALLKYPLPKDGAILIEYVLIKSINDTVWHARQLGHYLSDLKIKVNLIGYNPYQDSPYAAPSQADLILFRNELIKQNIFVRLRASKGRRIMAACGQLGS
jgi:23S rRNA (adenine2503-C2)-methyltransferase